MFDGRAQAADGQRILGPHINESLIGPHRISGDGHAFEYGMRIALEHAAVHERTGIALVGIADDVFFGAGRFGDGAPLQAGRESGTAAAAQSAADDGFDHALGILLGERVEQRGVAVGGDVTFDALGIDDAAVGEHHGFLEGEKRRVRIGLFGFGLAALERGDDRRGGLRRDVDIERLGRVHLHQRAGATEFHAAHATDFHLVLESGFGHGPLEAFFDTLGIRRRATGRHATTQDDLFP